tara:strand:- start:19 stop:708 length:690 start_codon:yes stop_codon:yes gene_type:complete
MISDKDISICLIEPLYPLNVGYVARIMKNFGFDKLLLCNSDIDLQKARPFASHGVDILDNCARISFNDLNMFDTLIATTAITSQRGISSRQSISVSELRESLNNVGQNICLIFGRDNTGLTNYELEQVDIVLHIPTNSSYSTLNISHALSIILYEISNTTFHSRTIANRDAINMMTNTYIDIATKLNLPEHKIHLIEKSLNHVIKRGKPSPRETSILLGFAKKILLRLR